MIEYTSHAPVVLLYMSCKGVGILQRNVLDQCKNINKIASRHKGSILCENCQEERFSVILHDLQYFKSEALINLCNMHFIQIWPKFAGPAIVLCDN